MIIIDIAYFWPDGRHKLVVEIPQFAIIFDGYYGSQIGTQNCWVQSANATLALCRPPSYIL